MQVPAFLLRRLYVKGSLRNTASGIAFELKNTLGSGYAEAVRGLTTDGAERPADACRFVVDGQALPFDAVSPQRPMTLAMNRTVVIEADGPTLASGEHTIALTFLVTGMGEMSFDVTDTVRLAEDGGS